jgi:alkylated DNA repair protein (DNA oxidative demethylase)
MERTRPANRATMPPSRLCGLPATVPPPNERARGQLVLPMGKGGMAGEGRASVHRREPLPGAVHVEGWLGIEAQRDLVRRFRLWALPPAGLRQPRVPSGHLMSVRSVCLGWHWQPYVYSRTADDTDGAPVKPLPRELAPDAAIVNFYEPDARLGLHQDAEEPADAPVVTISLGDACVFRFAGVERRTAPFTDVELSSGDLLVFGGPIRRIYHGVPKLLPGTAPAGLGLPPGRLSITVRETGFDRNRSAGAS